MIPHCSDSFKISSVLVRDINFDKHFSKQYAQPHIDFVVSVVSDVNTKHPNELLWSFHEKYSRYNI